MYDFWANFRMDHITESEAQKRYIEYQNSVMTNDRIMTFLEWVRETKTVLKDVDQKDFAEVM